MLIDALSYVLPAAAAVDAPRLSPLETAVVAIVVGVIGGLLGAIAGPFLTHKFDRRRRSEVREENRNQELRHMIEAIMRLARVARSSTLEMEYTDIFAGDVNPVLLRHDQYVLELEGIYRHLLWRPRRIRDGPLRTLAEGLNSAQGQLHILIGIRRGVPLGTIVNWSHQVKIVRHWVDTITDEVDRQMDDLDW